MKFKQSWDKMGIVVAIIEFVRVSPTCQIASTAKLPGLTLHSMSCQIEAI